MRATRQRTPEQERLAYNGLATSDVAARWGCSEAHVCNLITHGDEGRRLRAIDIGTGKRPEYRTREEWVLEFETRREVASGQKGAESAA